MNFSNLIASPFAHSRRHASITKQRIEVVLRSLVMHVHDVFCDCDIEIFFLTRISL